MYRNSGKVEQSFIFLPSVIKKGTREPLKRVIKAQQDEEQLAISVTPSTCSKQMVGEGGGGGGREKQKSPVTH